MKALKWIGGVFAVLLVLGVIGSLLGPSPKTSQPLEEAAAMAGARSAEGSATEGDNASVTSENDPGISAAEFAALRTGMSHAEVEAVVGSPGELLSENEIAGTRTFMVQWQGETGFGANANAMFQNGKLMQKSQFGL